MKLWIKILIGVATVVAALGTYAYIGASSLTIEKITDDLHVLYGIGGNVAVLKTDAGTVVVDTMTLQLQGRRIQAEAEKLTGQPVVMIINTHYHTDHTHGNPAFASGTRVVATERTLQHLQIVDSDYFSGAAAALLPNETFDGSFHRISLGKKILELYHTGRGHTDGDLAVLFVEDRVLHTGDLFFNKHYPNIDLEAGGSVMEWSDTLEPLLQLPFDKVIPGHGALATRDALLQFQQFMEQLATIGEQAAAQGLSKQQTQQSDALTLDEEYTALRFLHIPIGLSREFVLGRAWDEATGNFQRRE